MNEIPYRALPGIPCRVCDAILVGDDTNGPLTCPRGCGEWFGAETIELNLCPQMLSTQSKVVKETRQNATILGA